MPASVGTNILRFPGTIEKPPPPPAPLPPLDTFDAENTKTMGEILDSALLKAKVLVDFMHQDRQLASQAGVEGLGVEIAALMDSDKFSKMKAALFEAVRRGEGVTLTHEGLGRLHRLEALVSEGSQLLARYKDVGKKVSLSGASPAPERTSTADTVLLGAIVVLGVVAITVTAFLLAQRNDPRRIISGGGPFLRGGGLGATPK